MYHDLWDMYGYSPFNELSDNETCISFKGNSVYMYTDINAATPRDPLLTYHVICSDDPNWLLFSSPPHMGRVVFSKV